MDDTLTGIAYSHNMRNRVFLIFLVLTFMLKYPIVWLSEKAEAIRTTVVPISGVIRTTVVPISGVIGPTVLRIANATGIGYRHDGSIRFSYKLTNALNY